MRQHLVHQYTDEELSEKGDEMVLVMLINKIQNLDGWKKFTEEDRELLGEEGMVWESYLHMQKRWTYRLNEGILQEKRNVQMRQKTTQTKERQQRKRGWISPFSLQNKL